MVACETEFGAKALPRALQVVVLAGACCYACLDRMSGRWLLLLSAVPAAGAAGLAGCVQ